MPVFHSASDYLINRARRGELESQLSLAIAGALCVSSDAGEDHNKAREATALIHSLKAGGLLATIARDGHDYIEPAALLAVADRLAAVGVWGEGAQLWAGAAAIEGRKPLTTPDLKLALIGTTGTVKNKKRDEVTWDDFIRLPAFREAAHAGKGRKFDLWREADARNFADRSGYTFERATGQAQGMRGGALTRAAQTLTRKR